MPTIDEKGSLTLDEVVDKYPQVPRLIAIKIDVQRRGVHYTDRALSRLDSEVHQLRGATLFGSRDAKFTPLPESLILRDGTTILTDPTPIEQNPYIVDFIDGRLVLSDQGELVEEVEYWSKPDYYGKKTSSGKVMEHLVTARPQRLQVFAKPHGFQNENDALKAVLEEAEELAANGVSTIYMVWIPRPRSYFHDQQNASLEYYVALAIGLHQLRKKYALGIDFDDYRRCGNHPDGDLARVL